MSQVQTITGNSGSTSGATASVGTAFGSNITSGNRICVYVSAVNVGGTAQTVIVSDSAGNAYTELAYEDYEGISGKGGGPSVWLAPITAGAGTKPTVTAAMTATGGVTFCQIVFSAEERTEAFTGLDVCSYGLSGDVQTDGTTHASPACMPSRAGSEYVVGVYAGFSFSSPTLSVGSSSPTLTLSTPLTVSQFLAVASGSTITGTTNSISWTLSTSDIGISLVVAFSTTLTSVMTPVTWQSARASNAGSGTTSPVTFPHNLGGYNGQATKLLAAVAVNTSARVTVTGISDGTNSMTFVGRTGLGAANTDVELWAMDTPAGDIGTAPTLTATMSGTIAGANDTDILIMEVGGLAVGNTLAAMVDGTAGTNIANLTSPTNPSNVSYSSGAIGEYLVIVGGDDGNGATYTLPSGFVDDPNSSNTNSTNADISAAYKWSTGGSEATAYTLSYTGTDEWGQILVAFYLAGHVTAVAADTSALPISPPGDIGGLPPIGPPPIRAFLVGFPQALSVPGSANPPIYDSSVAPNRPPGDVSGLPPIGPPPLRQFIIGLYPSGGIGTSIFTGTNTQSAVGRISESLTSTQSAVARISKTETKTQSAVARIVNTETKTQSSIARVSASLTSPQTAVARIAHGESFTQASISRIANSFTSTQSATVRIKNTAVAITQTATARIKNTAVTKTQTAVARVSESFTSTQTATVRVSKSFINTQSAISRIANSFTAAQSSVSRIKNTAVTKIQAATAQIVNTETHTQSAVVRISKGFSTTQSAVARIAHGESLTQTAISRIASSLTNAQSATGRIKNTAVIKTQSAVARIFNTETHTQPSVARISKQSTFTQTATAHLSVAGSKTNTQTATARVSSSFIRTQTAQAVVGMGGQNSQTSISRIVARLVKTQTATARIGTINIIGITPLVEDVGPAFSISVLNPFGVSQVSTDGDVTIVSVVVTG